MGTGTPLLKVGDETFDGKTEPIIGTTLTFATPPAGSSGIILGADSGDEYARRPRFDSLDWLPSYAHRNCRVPRMILMTHSVRTKFPADFLANGSDCKHIKRRTMRLRNIYIIYIIYIYIYIYIRKRSSQRHHFSLGVVPLVLDAIRSENHHSRGVLPCLLCGTTRGRNIMAVSC